MKQVDEVWMLPGEQMRREKKQRRRNRKVGEIDQEENCNYDNDDNDDGDDVARCSKRLAGFTLRKMPIKINTG